jgi:REP element-mobilizing transposase RayT
MSQSLAKVIVHVVYSTKNRRGWFRERAMRTDLYAYNSSVLSRGVDFKPILIGGLDDHIHILGLLSRKVSIAEMIKESKTQTSKWVKKAGPQFLGFQWQAGYGIFSVSPSRIPQVKRYIANQEQHHRGMSFQDEFRELCRRHGVAIDERYVWE